jgi:hypothetical protein
VNNLFDPERVLAAQRLGDVDAVDKLHDDVRVPKTSAPPGLETDVLGGAGLPRRPVPPEPISSSSR